MNDIDWGSESKTAPKAKARFPKWLWFCGGGCLLAVIAGVVLTIIIARVAGEKLDPKKQWTALAKVLPYEEQPTDLTLIPTGALGAMAPGVEAAWQFMLNDGTQVQIQHLVGDMADDSRNQIESGALTDAKNLIGPFKAHEVTSGEFEASGKTVRFVRLQTFEAGDEPTEPAETPTGEREELSVREAIQMATKMRILIADVTPKGVDGAVILVASKPAAAGALEQDQVIEFLRAFDLSGKK